MNKLFESVETISPYTTRYTFAPRTAAGETLVIDFVCCESSNSAGDLAHLWRKNGYTSCVLPTHWAVSTYATDADGYCWGRYNPTIKPGTHKLNFDWVLEATNDNRVALLNEIMRLAGINSRIVTRSVWHSRDFDSFRVGDHVDSDIVDELRDCLPPAHNSFDLFQLGEPYSYAEDPETGKLRATYDTFVRIARRSWVYAGHCFSGQTKEAA